ncbi:PRS fimbrial major pilin protein [Escherichia coli 1-392-07_S4_C3]|nr:PRS fimbrial major pilin protein [Escherichia coli 1-392-07_S4_C3]
MIKSVIAGAVAMAVVSFGANAAPQGQGEVSFKGTVVTHHVVLKLSLQNRKLILARSLNITE